MQYFNNSSKYAQKSTKNSVKVLLQKQGEIKNQTKIGGRKAALEERGKTFQRK